MRSSATVRARRVLFAFLLSTRAVVGFAQTPNPRDPREAQPERPTVATHAFTVSPGIVEIEVGVQSRPQLGTPGLIKVGLAPNIQLDIAPGWVRDAEGPLARSGFTDTTLGVKWHVADHVPVLASFAIQPSVTLSTGSKEDGLGAGNNAFYLLLVSSREIRGVSLDLNVGGTFRRETETTAATATLWAVAAAAPLSERWGWTAELFGYPGTAGPAGAPPVVAFLTGPMFTASKSWVFDAGVIVSVQGFGGTAVYAGLTWNVGRMWTPR